VLHAAIEIADAGGFESLTMRALAQRLGVEAMSLYNHVANKADLRDAIVDIALSEVEIPEPGMQWKASLRRSAISLYDVFRRHRWASRLMMATDEPSPSRLRWMEGVLATLRRAGCSPGLAHLAYHALDAHTTGFALWQANFPFADEADLAAQAQGYVRMIGDAYPYLVEHVHQHLAPDPDEPGEFEFGLDLILDGIDRRRAARRAPPNRPPAAAPGGRIEP
jgi:AcrR family transcriptional regulator